MRSFNDCCASGTPVITSPEKLVVGILNIMPTSEREPTEKMFERRFAASGIPIEIVWLHPEADLPKFKHTSYKYEVPCDEIYGRIDYLFRTGADAAYRTPEENHFLPCLRDSRKFTKGSTSLCWSAGQIFADDTDQPFSELLMSKDTNNRIKRSGYADYGMMIEMDNFKTPHECYMASSRHFKVDARTQMDRARKSGFQPIAVSTTGHDVAGFVKVNAEGNNDILFFVHTEYGPDRLPYETNRDIGRTTDPAKIQALKSRFPEYKSMEQGSDELGQRFFNAALKTAYDAKSAPAVQPIYALEKVYA